MENNTIKKHIQFIFWRKYKDTNYIISTNGKVYNIKRNMFLKCSMKHGYCIVSLSENNKRKMFRIHRLVAEIFIHNTQNKPIVNHIDGNKTNNNLNNLEWVTYKENTQHALKNSLIKRKNTSYKYNKIINFSLENGKQIENYETYYIFKNGNVYNTKTKILLKPFKKADGYMSISLSKNGKSKLFLLHVLVAKAFIYNKENKPIINHKDGNKTNNDISNLEWVTESENVLHSLDNGLSNIRKEIIQYSLNLKEIARFKSIKEAYRQTNIHDGNISSVCMGKYKTAGGFIWKYVNDKI